MKNYLVIPLVATLFLLLSLLLNMVQAQEGKQHLTFGFTEACPHMCPNSTDKGFTVDIAKAIYEKQGYQVKFMALPWARAAANTLEGYLDGVLSTGKKEAPGLLFPEIEIAVQSDCFFGRSSDSWIATDANSFRNRKTIVFKGWVNEEVYRATLGNETYNETFEEFSIDEHYNERVANMVLLGRADAFWMDINVFAYFTKNNPTLIENKIKNLGCVEHQNLYLALSPKNKKLSDKLARTFNEGMKELRSSGALTEILHKYGLKDWEAVSNPSPAQRFEE